MLFQVAMTIRVPHDADQAKIKQLSAAEMELAAPLARMSDKLPSELTKNGIDA